MLDDALAHLERQIQPAELRIAQLQIFHGAQGLQIVIKKAPLSRISRSRTRSPAWPNGGCPKVMHQRQRFHQVDVKMQRCGDGRRNLRHFHGVRQTGAEVIGVGG